MLFGNHFGVLAIVDSQNTEKENPNESTQKKNPSELVERLRIPETIESFEWADKHREVSEGQTTKKFYDRTMIEQDQYIKTIK